MTGSGSTAARSPDPTAPGSQLRKKQQLMTLEIKVSGTKSKADLAKQSQTEPPLCQAPLRSKDLAVRMQNEQADQHVLLPLPAPRCPVLLGVPWLCPQQPRSQAQPAAVPLREAISTTAQGAELLPAHPPRLLTENSPMAGFATKGDSAILTGKASERFYPSEGHNLFFRS